MLSSGLGSSSSLLYSQMFPRPLFPLTLGLTITKQRLVQPLTLCPSYSIALKDSQQKTYTDHVHEPSLTFPAQPTSPMTSAGVACTQKTNSDASWLQCQKMGQECTHAIECISFFTGIVDIYYSFACLVLPYPGNTGENKPYQWDLPKNKRMKVTVKTKWAKFFNWPRSQSAWVLVCALWTGSFVTLGLGFHTLGLGE